MAPHWKPLLRCVGLRGAQSVHRPQGPRSPPHTLVQAAQRIVKREHEMPAFLSHFETNTALATNTPPYTTQRIVKCEYEMPAYLSPPLRDLLARLLERDPRQRMRVEAIQGHPWFAVNLPPGAGCMNHELIHNERYNRGSPACLQVRAPAQPGAEVYVQVCATLHQTRAAHPKLVSTF